MHIGWKLLLSVHSDANSINSNLTKIQNSNLTNLNSAWKPIFLYSNACLSKNCYVTMTLPCYTTTTNHGQHTERKTTSLAWTCLPYGPQAHTTASTALAGTRIQERTRSTKSELEGRGQQRPTKDGVYLGGSRGGSSWQTRIASECGPMCPVGYRLN